MRVLQWLMVLVGAVDVGRATGLAGLGERIAAYTAYLLEIEMQVPHTIAPQCPSPCSFKDFIVHIWAPASNENPTFRPTSDVFGGNTISNDWVQVTYDRLKNILYRQPYGNKKTMLGWIDAAKLVPGQTRYDQALKAVGNVVGDANNWLKRNPAAGNVVRVRALVDKAQTAFYFVNDQRIYEMDNPNPTKSAGRRADLDIILGPDLNGKPVPATAPPDRTGWVDLTINTGQVTDYKKLKTELIATGRYNSNGAKNRINQANTQWVSQDPNNRYHYNMRMTIRQAGRSAGCSNIVSLQK